MHIFFLRHGDASSDSRYSDSERPLTDLGMRQAKQVGSFLQRMNVNIDAALSSPLKRAQETAAIVLSKIYNRQIAVSELLLNGTDPKRLFEQLDKREAPSVLLVGHEPFLSETISLLIGGNRKVEIEMRKCSIALVDVPFPIHPGAGMLKFLIPVETIT
jgi:phosphohistidine phosphatase